MSAKPEPRKPIKVAVIHPECGVSWNGGSQISAYEMAEHLAAHYEVELLCGEEVGTVSVVLPCVPRGRSANWLATTYIGGLFRKAFGYPGMVIEAATSFFPYLFHLLKSKPDIVYPNNDYGGLAIAWVLKRLIGSKILYTERAGLLSDGHVLKRNMKFKPDHLVVFNQDTVDTVNRWYPGQPVSAIPNGVDLSRFAATGDTFDFQLSGKLVLCVGTLNRKNHKRMELAIKAMAQVPEASLILCGDGVDKDYYIALGEELLGKKRFKQMSLSFDEMPKLYRSVDLFTLPSANEPFGRVYLEALASGTPVVAPDDTMRRTIIGNAGIVCNVEDSTQYAESLSLALSTDWQTRTIEQASKFSWAAIALQYKSVIDRMVKSKG
ncbi:glycosyltransferase [Paraglaciecola chathamensis]|jgi:glycosyltransferase involved in cell wall biosynthesis|uniref:Glycosyl transferase, group 1 n=1 Tax=Paraglaciecola agarilytica NO2 TaxID=1125747 RepID=A0ABQ0I921_9ALTE|nr:glycosyltransferase [Paraglaciecola agarilytica]GAC05838.1 glycosyl transferase, group 1 [Paraglaciecola agarilytica NO2]